MFFHKLYIIGGVPASEVHKNEVDIMNCERAGLYCHPHTPGKNIIGLGDRFGGIPFDNRSELYGKGGAGYVVQKLPFDLIIIEPHNEGDVFFLAGQVIAAVQQGVYHPGQAPILSIAKPRHDGLIKRLQDAYDLPVVRGYVYGRCTLDAGLSGY